MLHIYPETLLDYAVDDVIYGPSRAHAEGVHRLLQRARKEARRERERARTEAEALRAQALQEGYRDGMVQALHSLLPMLQALQGEQHTLVDGVRMQMRECIQAMAGVPGVVVPQLLAACEHWVPQPGSTTPATLHVPEQQTELLAVLLAEPRLAALRVCSAPRAQPLLEVGAMAYVLDLAAPLEGAVETELERHLPRLQHALPALSAAYAQRLQAALAAIEAHARLSKVHAPADGNRPGVGQNSLSSP